MIKHGTLLFLFGAAVVSGMVLRPEIKPEQIIVTPDPYISSLGYWPSNAYFGSVVPSPVVGFSSGWKSSTPNEASKNSLQLKLKVPCSEKHHKAEDIKPLQEFVPPLSLSEPIYVEEIKINDQPIPIEQFVKPVEIPEAPVLSPFSMPDLSAIQIEAVTPSSDSELEHDIYVNITKTLELPQSLSKRPEEVFVPAQIPDEEVKEEFVKPVDIPKAPELPPFTIPEIPVVVEYEKLTGTRKPCKSEQSSLPHPEFIPAKMEEVPIFENRYDFVKLADIPKAPELPPFSMPLIPAIVPETLELPKLPQLSQPPLSLVEWVPTDVETYHIPEPAIKENPYETMIIKKAPQLSPFVMPELPVNVEVKLFPENEASEVTRTSVAELLVPSLPESIEHNIKPDSFIEEEYIKPDDIPKAPGIPPFEMLAIQAFETEPCDTRKAPETMKMEFIDSPELPKAPELFTLSLPEGVPADVESYRTPEPEIKEESHYPTNIPKAPELPPFSMPIIPVDVEVELSSETEPCDSIKVSELQPKALELPTQSLPESIADYQEPGSKTEEEFTKPAEIPKAPELLPFLMPEIPAIEHIDEKVAALPVMPLFVNVAEVPRLPNLSVPEWIPARVNLPESQLKKEFPSLIAMPKVPELHLFSEIPIIADAHKISSESEPCDNGPESPLFMNHIDLPPAPELPKIPKIVVEEPCAKDESTWKLEGDILPVKPVVIPEPPFLPSFVMPKLDDVIIENPQNSQVVDKIKEFRPMIIPDAPELPPLYRFAGMKVPFVNEKYDLVDKVISSGPAFTSACVQNIISERVLPKIVAGYPKVPVFTYV